MPRPGISLYKYPRGQHWPSGFLSMGEANDSVSPVVDESLLIKSRQGCLGKEKARTSCLLLLCFGFHPHITPSHLEISFTSVYFTNLKQRLPHHRCLLNSHLAYKIIFDTSQIHNRRCLAGVFLVIRVTSPSRALLRCGKTLVPTNSVFTH